MPRPIPGMSKIIRAPTGLTLADIKAQANAQKHASTSKEERRLKTLLAKAGQQNGLLLDDDMREVRELVASLGATVTVKHLELNDEYNWRDNPGDNPFTDPPTYIVAPTTITTWQIQAPHFVAGVAFDGDKCTHAAPIVKYMVGWSIEDVVEYCRVKGYGIAIPTHKEIIV